MTPRNNGIRNGWIAALLAAAYFCLIFSPSALAQNEGHGQYIIVLDEPSVIEQMAREAPGEPFPARLNSLRAVEYDSYLAARQEQIGRALESLAHIRVQGQTRTVLNAIIADLDLNDVARISALPGVRTVHRSREFRLVLNRAVPLVNANPGAWNLLGGMGQAGLGLKIAIIDTGIDITNPMFQDLNLTAPPGYPKGESAFTNSKVIVARNYVSLLPNPDTQTAEDRVGHGSFVAGCAAGNQTSQPGLTIFGVAPKAFLGSYKVFGTPGVNDTATDGAILQALNDAVADGMNIVNMSFGGLADQLPASDPEVQAINNAVQAGVIVVVAAGNEGNNGPATVDSPGTAPSAITVGASTNSHTFRPFLSVTAPTPVPSNLQFVAYAPGTGPIISATIGPLPIVDTTTLGDTLACNALPAGSLTGKIALIQRGTCTFLTKVTNATNAGAQAVIVFNSATQPNEYVTMAGLDNTTIPAVFILNADGVSLQNFMGSNPSTARVQIGAENSVIELPATPDVMADFSSFGPNVDLSIKPDLVAPGVNIFSAGEKTYPNGPLFSSNGFLLGDGTSFSTPIVAGAAALVKQFKTNFTPAQVKSALVNRANPQVTQQLPGGSSSAAAIQMRGGGRLDVLAAMQTNATVSPVSISFGNVTSATTVSRSLTIQNITSSSDSYTITVETFSGAPAGASVAVSPGSLNNIAAGASGNVTVSLQVSSVSPGVIQGQIHILPASGSQFLLLVPFWAAINNSTAAAAVNVADGDQQSGTAGSALAQQLVARVLDSNGVPLSGVSVQWASQNGGSVSPTSSTTDQFGLAATNATLGSATGQQTFTATVGSFSATFTVTAAAGAGVTISSVTPNSDTPTGGTTVVISGTGFQSGATVTFGTELAQIISSIPVTSTAIHVTSPPNNPGTVNVTVTNPDGGSATLSNGFTYVAPSSTTLGLTKSSLTFFAVLGDTRVQQQGVGIVNLASGSANWTASVSSSNTPWLSITPSSGTTAGTVVVLANPRGLAPGQFSGQVTITAGGSTVNVSVTLTVLTASPSLFLAQVGDGQLAGLPGGVWRTTIVLVNPNASAANVTVIFRANDGSPLTVHLLSGQSGSTLSNLQILPHGTLFMETDGSTPTAVVGSAVVQSNLAIGGAAIFLQRVPNRLDFEAGIGLALPASTVVIPVDNTTGYQTGVAMVNGSSQAASMSLVFRNELGVVQGVGSVQLTGSGHFSDLIKNLIAASQGIRGSLTIQAPAGGSVAAISVRGQDSGALTTLPAVDNSSPAASFTLPQVVDGQAPDASSGGTQFFDTTWIFLNPGFSTANDTMSLRDNNGSPLSVTLVTGQTGTDFVFNLGARQALFLQTNSGNTTEVVGQSLVNGNANGNLPIGGAALFRQRVPGRPNFEAGIPFSIPGQRFVVPFDNSPGFNSGVAVSNTSNASLSVTFIVRDVNGNVLTNFSQQLAASGHTSFILSSVQPLTVGQRGSLEISASAAVITAIGIRAFDSGPLTTLPVTPVGP